MLYAGGRLQNVTGDSVYDLDVTMDAGTLEILNGSLRFDRNTYLGPFATASFSGNRIAVAGMFENAGAEMTGGELVVQDTSLFMMTEGLLDLDTLDIEEGGTFGMTGGRLVADQVFGDLDIAGGTVVPHQDSGILNVAGDFRLRPSAKLEVELNGQVAGWQHAKLMAVGDVVLSGELELTNLGAGTFAAGEEYTIVVGNSVSGEFEGLADGDVVGNSQGLDFFIQYASDSVSIITAEETPKGIQLVGDVLHVNGTNNADGITVVQGAAHVSVTLNDCPAELFAGVNEVVIEGLAGDDIITAVVPGVIIYGGTGNDRITVNGSGPSQIFGEAGNDIILGSAGPDHIEGGEGDDDINGRNGADHIDGGAPPIANPGSEYSSRRNWRGYDSGR